MKINTEYLESIKDKKFVMSPHMLAAEISTLINVLLQNPKELLELTSFSEDKRRLFCDKYAVDYVKNITEQNLKSKPDDPEEYQ